MNRGLILLGAVAGAGLAAAADAAVLPAPTRGVTANLSVTKGNVFLSSGKVTAPMQIRIGAVVNARQGGALLSLAKDSQGHVQTGIFSGGIFRVVQARSAALTEVRLGGGRFETCTGRGNPPHRRLAANVHGSFRVRGRYSTATAGGTIWLTTDTCAGTLTVVTRGTVVVRDAVRRKTVRVKAGHRYLARPR